MKKVFMMAFAAVLMAVAFASCSASSDDEMSEGFCSTESNFSLISYTMSAGSTVGAQDANNNDTDEKLVCKVLPGGKLMLTHKNVIFDEGINIKFATELAGNKIIITETGDYGKSGKYGYYTLVAKVGTVKDGEYTIVVKRNDHVREEFKMKYDSSKARE